MEPASLGKTLSLVPTVLEEAAEELVGKSKRKWALVLVAFVVGAIAAVVVVRFEMRRIAADEPDLDVSDAGSGAAPSIDLTEASAWSQLRRSEAALRERVGNVGSRMNVRRARSIDQ